MTINRLALCALVRAYMRLPPRQKKKNRKKIGNNLKRVIIFRIYHIKQILVGIINLLQKKSCNNSGSVRYLNLKQKLSRERVCIYARRDCVSINLQLYKKRRNKMIHNLEVNVEEFNVINNSCCFYSTSRKFRVKDCIHFSIMESGIKQTNSFLIENIHGSRIKLKRKQKNRFVYSKISLIQKIHQVLGRQ